MLIDQMNLHKINRTYLLQQPRNLRLSLGLQQPGRQTDGQNINRIDAHIREEWTQKKSDLYLIQGPRKSRFPLKVSDRHGHTDYVIKDDHSCSTKNGFTDLTASVAALIPAALLVCLYPDRGAHTLLDGAPEKKYQYI